MITMRRFSIGGFTIGIGLIFILILGAVICAPPEAQSAIPRYINYQGKLTDANDNPVTGSVSVTIRIYDGEAGGAALWTEVQTVTVTKGIFSILLGNVTALDSLGFDIPYWYSVEIASDGEMTPRQRLTAVAYAINADKIDGYDASQFLRSDSDTSLTGGLTVSGAITGSANGDITFDPTGTGNIVMKIDSTSGDFKITDGTTNWVLVDNATGNVTIAKDLTVNGMIYGTIASTAGSGTFTSITVTGASDLKGNVDAGAGIDVTGALTVSGQTTLGSALDVNSNIDLDYSGTSAALDVTQASTGAAAKFTGGNVIIGSNTSNGNALSSGELYVQGDLEVDGTIYGNVSASGSTSLGSTTLSSLTVSGTSDLQGNVSDSGGTFTIADQTAISVTDSSTSGTATAVMLNPTFQDGGIDSSTTAIAMNVAPTVNYTGSSKTGSYTALKISATETSLPSGTNYLIDAYAGSGGATQKFYVDNSGNTKIFGTLNMNSQKITNLATPTANTDAATKAYADGLTLASAGGWTDGGVGVYLTSGSDNVGIGTDSTASYKLNVSGATNTTSFYIGGTQVTANAAEINKLAGASANVTAANLGTLTGTGNADSLHTHTSGLVATSSGSTQTITSDVQIDTSGNNPLVSITQTDASASLAIAIDTTKADNVAGHDSDGLLKLGINEGKYQYLWYDTDAGTDGAGAFIFSDQAVIPTASPAYLNFGMDKDVNGKYTSYYAVKMDPDPDSNVNTTTRKFSVVSIPNPGANWQTSEKPLFDIASDGSFNIYDPTVDEAVFQIEPGGRLAHDFRNMVKNGSFEAFSGFERFMGYDPNCSQSGVYNNTELGYRGGWGNFAPDEWVWIEGKILQHAPALFATSGTGTYNTDFYDGKSAVAINEWVGKRNLNYALESPSSGNDAAIKQTIKGLEPNTWYSIGAAMMVTNAASTTAILDITGEYKPTTTLSSAIQAGDALNGSASSTVSVTSTTDFPAGGTSKGIFKIGSELFTYTGKTSTTFTGVTRAITPTTAATHSSSAAVTGIFNPLVSTSTTFESKKGSFKTDSVGSDITIYLLCQQATGATNDYFARFDGIQLVEGRVLPKYTATSIIDIGDQSIYGTLKLGRSADGRGGILSVDQFVRTRGIDFFSDDPGVSGTTGGGGSIGTVYNTVNMVPYTDTLSSYSPGIVKMEPNGNYIDRVTRKFQVRVQGSSYDTPNGYIRYRSRDCINPMQEALDTSWGTWSSWSSDIIIPATAGENVYLNYGINVKFSAVSGFKAGDQWEFKTYGMSPEQTMYDSFNKQAEYKAGEARIYKDSSTGELTFEDSKAGKVKLSEIISQKSSSYISPPVRDPANMGTTNITATGALNTGMFTSAQNFEVWTEWAQSGEPLNFGWSIMWTSTTTGTYTWHGNWGQTINKGTAAYLISSNGNQNTGIAVTFPSGSTLYNYERWKFFASPSSASNVATHGHSSSGDGGTFAASGTSATSFKIAKDSISDPLDVGLYFNDYETGTQQDRYIKWNDTNDRFDVSNNVSLPPNGLAVGTNQLVVSAGNVGIGTTAPVALLDIYNNPANNTGIAVTTLIKPDYSLLNTAGDGYTALKINVTDASAGALGAQNLIDLQVGSSSKFKVDDSGNLTMAGNLTLGSVALNATGTGAATSGASKIGTYDEFGNSSSTNVQDVLDDLDQAIATAGVQNLWATISSQSGNTTASSATDTLTVNGAGIASTAIVGDTLTITATEADTLQTVAARGSSYTAGVNLATSGGNVGIGTTNPVQKLDVNGIIIANNLSLRGSSPATITFGSGSDAKQMQFDSTTQEFSFTGGTLKQAFQNLIKNPSFETTKPTGWQGLIDYYAAYQTNSGTTKFGSYSGVIKDTSASDNQGIFAPISDYDPDWKRLQGKTVTLSLWAKADSSVTTTIGFDSTGTESNSSASEIVPEQFTDINLTTAWNAFTVSYNVPSGATKLRVILYGAQYSADGSSTYTQNIYFDGLTMVEGKLALEYGPSPIFDTGNQVVYGSLAIGANYNPDTSSDYSQAPRLIFGQPDSYFGAAYSGWGCGSGEIRFMKYGTDNIGTFMINRGVWLYDNYGTDYGATLQVGYPTDPHYANLRGDIYARGRLELTGAGPSGSPTLIVGSSDPSGAETQKPTFATSPYDAYVRGKIETDSGFYGSGANITGISGTNVSGIAAITGVSGLDFAINADATSGEGPLTLTFNRGATDAVLTWNETTDEFDFNYPINVTSGGLTTQGAISNGTISLSGATISGATAVTVNDGGSLTFQDASATPQTIMQVDESTRTVQIYNLTVNGTQTVVNTTTTDANYWAISPNAVGTTAISIVPDAGITLSGNIITAKKVSTGGNVFVLDKDGNITTVGTVDGIDISAHDTATTGVHGVGAGAIVGTTLTQTLTNKDLSSATNTLPTNYYADTYVNTSGNETMAGSLTAASFAFDNSTLNAETWSTTSAGDITLSPAGNNILPGTDGTIDLGTIATIELMSSAARDSGTGSLTLTTSGTFTTYVDNDLTYRVQIDGAGNVGVGTYKWSRDGGSTWAATALTTSATAFELENGLSVAFGGTGGVVGDYWDITITKNTGFKNVFTNTITTDKVYTPAITAENSGGTVTVTGSMSVSGDLTVQGQQQITGGTVYVGQDVVRLDHAQALLVEKAGADGSGTDIFFVDTIDQNAELYSALGIGKSPASGVELDVLGDGDFSGTLNAGTNDAFQVSGTGAITSLGLNAGTGLITTSGNITTTGSGVMISAGLLTASAGINVSGASNIVLNTDKIILYGANGNATMAGTLTQLRSVGLVPDYDSASFSPDSTDNFGTLMLKYANAHNYYEWTTSEPTVQDYDIVVRYRLPDGFTSFDTTTPIKLWNDLSAFPNASTVIKIQLLDTNGTSVLPISSATGSYANDWLTLNQNTSWTETTITINNSATELTSSDAGKYITLKIRLVAYQGDTVDVGEMTLKGNW